jgi:hypothetical protein
VPSRPVPADLVRGANSHLHRRPIHIITSAHVPHLQSVSRDGEKNYSHKAADYHASSDDPPPGARRAPCPPEGERTAAHDSSLRAEARTHARPHTCTMAPEGHSHHVPVHGHVQIHARGHALNQRPRPNRSHSASSSSPSPCLSYPAPSPSPVPEPGPSPTSSSDSTTGRTSPAPPESRARARPSQTRPCARSPRPSTLVSDSEDLTEAADVDGSSILVRAPVVCSSYVETLANGMCPVHRTSCV